MKWEVLETSSVDAAQNMAKDQQLLEESSRPTLHFYQWNGPSATYGYFIKPEDHLNLIEAKRLNLQLARRQTGGGIIFHLYDLAFSVWVPHDHPAYSVNTLDNYAFVNTRVAHAIQAFSGTESHILQQEFPSLDKASSFFCMAKPTIYDVLLNGRKVGGGAQRRTKRGFLHQGSINLALPEESFLKAVLLPNTCVLQAMQQHSCLLSNETEKSKVELKDHLIHAFTSL